MCTYTHNLKSRARQVARCIPKKTFVDALILWGNFGVAPCFADPFFFTCITNPGQDAFGSRSYIALFLLCFIPLGICLRKPFHLLTTNDA